MKQSIVQRDMDEVLEPLAGAAGTAASTRQPSYRPTSWKFVNHILDIVDNLSGGRAGLAQKFFSFAFIGGFAALVNLAVFAIMLYKVLPAKEGVYYAIAFLVAFEISVLANFIPNDYFTFRHLHNGQRSWLVRCFRFQLTALTGGALTFVLSFAFAHLLNLPPIISQAAATLIVLFYNFAFHHLFTYRHKKVDVPEEFAVVEESERLVQKVTEQLSVDVDTLKMAVAEPTV